MAGSGATGCSIAALISRRSGAAQAPARYRRRDAPAERSLTALGRSRHTRNGPGCTTSAKGGTRMSSRPFGLGLGTVLLAVTTAHGAAVMVREPAFGFPHFYADTELELARMNGREIAKDRLVQMILLARVGRGTLYQACGVLDPSTLQDDIEARRTAYTSSELNGMFAKWPQRERELAMEYCRGVN